MTIDKVYRKQLETFGIEFNSTIDDSATKKQRQEFALTQSDVIKGLMSNMQGREWLYSKLDMCRVFSTPFVPSDAHGTSFFAGIQAVGHNLLDDIIRNSSENFSLMIQEAAARADIKKQD